LLKQPVLFASASLSLDFFCGVSYFRNLSCGHAKVGILTSCSEVSVTTEQVGTVTVCILEVPKFEPYLGTSYPDLRFFILLLSFSTQIVGCYHKIARHFAPHPSIFIILPYLIYCYVTLLLDVSV